jgi:UDP-N-acetylmuramyl pentapeptide phosphotransferase/UDP-N-acetylglucosamine-1-phosphate transferase
MMIQPIYIFLLVALIVSVTIAMLVLPNILLISHKKKLFDMPDKRKVHHAPIPRLGGLSFFPVILTCLWSWRLIICRCFIRPVTLR